MRDTLHKDGLLPDVICVVLCPLTLMFDFVPSRPQELLKLLRNLAWFSREEGKERLVCSATIMNSEHAREENGALW